jgi:steroid 5-alpha reductase family enzyme
MTIGLLLGVLSSVALALGLVMSGAWLVWRRTGNSGWVDTVWTFGLGGVGIAGAFLAPGSVSATWWRPQLVAGLVALWALRLGVHIARRTRGIKDDPRYAKLMEGWGEDGPWQMYVLLQKQALVSIPLAVSILLAAWNPVATFRPVDLIGVLVLLVGIGGETLADRQLDRFRRDPVNRGRVCDVGLWRWSRHPNYFFEWVCWLAYPLLAVPASVTYPWGWLALAGPLCMYWLLRHVSGVPPLEMHMLESRGAAYRAYQARTSAFFPLPSKNEPAR